MNPSEVQALIQAGMPDAGIEVSDMTGTGDHFNITVTSKSFSGKTLIEQHRLVFALLEKEMNNRIHAVQLKTKIPS